MRSNVVGMSGCWVEVRPLVTSDLKTGNFVPVLEVLFNCGKPFRFIVVDSEDENVCGRRLVRFFIEFFDEPMLKQMTNVIRAMLNVEVVAASPSQMQYECCVDFVLAQNYALPVYEAQGKAGVNLIDGIVATVAGSGTAIEVTAQADRKAAVGIQNYIHGKIYQKSNVSNSVLDVIVGVLAELSGRSTKSGYVGHRLRSGQRHKVDLWVREIVKNAELKLHSSLFTCQVKVYGNSLDKILAAKNALPSFMNYFKIFRTKKKPSTVEALRKPSRHNLNNLLLSRLWWIMPLSTLSLACLVGVFNPVRLVSLPGITVDLCLLGTAGFSSVTLYLVFRKHNPVVLSTQELAQIIGLPSSVGKLSVAIGQTPPTRMQLGSEEETQTKPHENDQTLN